MTQRWTKSFLETCSSRFFSIPLALFTHGIAFDAEIIENIKGTSFCFIIGFIFAYFHRRAWAIWGGE